MTPPSPTAREIAERWLSESSVPLDGTLTTLATEFLAQQERVRRLEEAMRRYAVHDGASRNPVCQAVLKPLADCTCGLSAALAEIVGEERK